MAQQTTVILTDDIDGGKAVETVEFGLDGRHYEIDLGAKNAKNLRKAVAAYIEAGRKVKIGNVTRSSTKVPAHAPAKPDRAELAAIRAWPAKMVFPSPPAAALLHRSGSSTSPPPAAEPIARC